MWTAFTTSNRPSSRRFLPVPDVTADGLTLRPAVPADAAALTAIAHASKRHWKYPERWIAAWRDLLTIDAALIAAMRVVVAEDAREPIAFIAVDVRGPRVVLEHLWVQPRALGRGIGRALVARAVAIAREAGATVLEVEADPNAEAFYARLGAMRVGQRRADVDGTERWLPVLEMPIGDVSPPVTE